MLEEGPTLYPCILECTQWNHNIALISSPGPGDNRWAPTQGVPLLVLVGAGWTTTNGPLQDIFLPVVWISPENKIFSRIIKTDILSSLIYLCFFSKTCSISSFLTKKSPNHLFLFGQKSCLQMAVAIRDVPGRTTTCQNFWSNKRPLVLLKCQGVVFLGFPLY